MDRTFYYVGIAFFGMINGLFNPTWVLFSVIHVQILAPALLFGSVPLTLMFASLMVSTATIIVGGIPAAITSMTGLIRSGLRRFAEGMNAAQPEHVEAVLRCIALGIDPVDGGP